MFLHIQQHIMHIFIYISFLTVISFLPMILPLSISYYFDMFCSIYCLDKFVNIFFCLLIVFYLIDQIILKSGQMFIWQDQPAAV